MSWLDNLQDATFRGVRFDVLRTQESVGRDHDDHEYPFLDGGDINDLGRKPRNFRLSALFWGDDYDVRRDAFIRALDTPGAGELIHPVYGSVPRVQLIEYQIAHDAENPDSCTLELVFLETGLGTALDSGMYPEQLGDGILDSLSSLTDNARTLFESAMEPVSRVKKQLVKGKTVLSGMLNTMTIMRSEVDALVSDGTDYLAMPRRYVNDLLAVLDMRTSPLWQLIDPPQSRSSSPSVQITFTPSGPSPSALTGQSSGNITSEVISTPVLLSAWGESVSLLNTLPRLPAALVKGDTPAHVPLPHNATVEDMAELESLHQVLAVNECVSMAVAIFSNKTLMVTLSPADIERITGDVRTVIQQAITLTRDNYTPFMQTVSTDSSAIGVLWQPVVAQLKSVALNVQRMAISVMSHRPVLTRREVPGETNLHLLAHLWYQDYTRAAELLRLNPQIRNPNALMPGDLLNAYVR
jgi:hypothetical protein